MLLAVIIEVTSLCLAVPAGAVNKSSDEAVSRAVSKIGSKVGSGQYVALIYAYYEFLGVRPTGGNACDYAKKTLPEGFDTIQYYPGFVAKPGDIAVWTSTLVIKDGKKVKNTLGHIAIVESANSISMNLIDQNNSAGGRDSNKQVVGRFENQPYEPNNGYDTFWGVIRPDFNDFKCDLVQLGDDSYGIYGCSRNSGNVTIPDKIDGKTITAILDRACKNCTSITGVSIPNTVTDIAYGAFESCCNLKSVSIPSSVKTIGPGAFINCTSLTDVTIPDGV